MEKVVPAKPQKRRVLGLVDANGGMALQTAVESLGAVAESPHVQILNHRFAIRMLGVFMRARLQPAVLEPLRVVPKQLKLGVMRWRAVHGMIVLLIRVSAPLRHAPELPETIASLMVAHIHK